MKDQQFSEEMHLYIDDKYKEFLKYQKMVRDILDEFHRICSLNQLPYCVAYGSLIGIIRDGGSIPWDYDVDVVIPYKYLDALINSLEKDLGPEYYYVYNNNVKDYPTSCLRVCKKGFTYMALHVDVFFLIGCPSDDQDRKKFMKKVGWIYKARQAKCLHKHINPDKKNDVLRTIYNIVKYPITLEKVTAEEKRLSGMYHFDQYDYCTIFFPSGRLYKKDMFSTVEKRTIGDKEYNIPRGYDAFLKQVYGDYHEYMPIKSRFEEFYKMTDIIEDRQEIYLKYLSSRIEL